MKNLLTIVRICSRTRARFRDGARVVHRTYKDLELGLEGRSVEQADRDTSSPLHKAMKTLGMAYFCRYPVFPRNVGLWGHEDIWRFADFAIEKGRRVRLVECLTPWNADRDTIEGKLQLDDYAPVDFICTRNTLRKFRRWRYKIVASLGKFERSEIVYIRKN